MAKVDNVRGDKPTMVRLDGKWRDRVVKDNRMPVTFEMTKKEWKEYSKNLGRKMTKKANEGLQVYRGARVKIV